MWRCQKHGIKRRKEIRRMANRFREGSRSFSEAAGCRNWPGWRSSIFPFDAKAIFDYSTARLGWALPGNSLRSSRVQKLKSSRKDGIRITLSRPAQVRVDSVLG